MRRFLTLYLTPIIGSIIILLHLPSIEHWLESFGKNADFYIAGFLILLALINHIITVYSPFEKYKKLENGKWFLLNFLIDGYIDKYSTLGIELHFNIMVPKRILFQD